ncbi:hypothetical protein SAMD00023353_1300190 [Rosellinia necatrix]|uniref:ubiquitinyl hydrolase 1 n=1 Tax=Rosellinia necatrix TaxID=77044 RepID=A0A1S8A6R1_ROSNE|nr:hypothetical protein SAMD00023353_1300190 [Rosellinia necatrix]
MDKLQAVFNHLTLPPEVPGAQDTDLDSISSNVIDRLIGACSTAAQISEGTLWQGAYEKLHECLQYCRELNTGRLEKSTLLKHFRQLKTDRPLVLYVNEQNACLLIRLDIQNGEQCVTFESFETSPTADKVLATAGHALYWDFPGRCAQIPLAEFTSQSFQECLAAFLEHASMESLYNLQASSRKAGVYVEEIRDTTDPALITHMLMSIFEAIGTSVQPQALRKKIRDDVNFRDDNLPWRRLPFWLILRVAAQRHLCLTLGNDQGQYGYKALISIVLAQLLADTSGRLSPHLTDRLRRKLARRMAKMETHRQKLETSTSTESQEPWFDVVSSMVRNAITAELDAVHASWNEFKRATDRLIQPLPVRAGGESLKLTLPNSGRHLMDLVSYREPPSNQLGPMSLPNPLDQGVHNSQEFTGKIHRLAAIEKLVEKEANCAVDAPGNREAHCIYLATRINEVMTEMRPEYEPHPEHMSSMILCLFTLWTELDKCVTAVCPLLLEHRPAFQPELLDALQLPTKQAMIRLQNIQEYLANRKTKSKYGSVLDSPSNTCFAMNYYRQPNDLQRLAARIREASDAAAAATRTQLNQVRAEYERLTEEISSYECSCITVDGIKKAKGCRKCPRIWNRNKLRVKIHEAYLPLDITAMSFLVFELAIPKFISAYRDATWHLLSRLAHPHRAEIDRKPVVHLRDCSTLTPFMSARVNSLSLASTIKCFSQTHYKLKRDGGNVPVKRVVLPFAAKFKLFDHEAQIWVENLRLPLTLEHLCGVHIPQGLRSVFPANMQPPTVVDGPSSYDIQANQGECPNAISVHEFSALQKLLSGKRRRWPNILMELTSSNINVSNEDTMMVLNQLAVQAGPALSGDPLRAVHEIFKDDVFTKKLLGIAETLLEDIKTNWREHNCMELLITLALRLLSLSSESQAVSFLRVARGALLKWIDHLRGEVRKTTDASAAQRFTTYGLQAALLCRRTFTSFVNSKETLSKEDLVVWVQCSMALQENILHDTKKLSTNLRSMLIRDAKLSFHIEHQIRDAMKSFRSSVGASIFKALHGESEALATSLASWTFLQGCNERWIVVTTSKPYPKRIHFNYIEGHLLVNGKPREKLPTAIVDDQDVKEIFGNQHLLTYPSNLPGMSHQLAQSVIQGHTVYIHFGLRNGCAVMRTCDFNFQTHKWEIREFIPQRRFMSLNSFDLPEELVNNCAHWLNLSTGCLEIRRASPGSRNFWITRDRDWIIDVKTRRATRGGKSNLVDPHCDIAIRIAKIFKFFEEPRKLTVYQPRAMSGRLSVALKHMDLLFEVNDNGELECRELNAKVDHDQDVGSWYGLRSKIVLRNIHTQSRSVLVPLGIPKIVRNGIHVDVHIDGATDYGSFVVDDILGRLSCKPEPRLVYSKALFHAATSFCLPDPLTNRTGSEEAFSILRSGAAQPWTPLPNSIYGLLNVFNHLAPARSYYPPPLKRLQTVKWDANLTSTIQLDGYKPIIERIIRRSNDLGTFHGTNVTSPEDPGHLCLRGMHQRNVYERPIDGENLKRPPGQLYRPRDRYGNATSAQVYQIARAILSGGTAVHTKSTLKDLLEPCKVIGGFLNHRVSSLSTKPLLNRVETPVNEQWGELVRLCQRSNGTSDLLFLLGLLAFNEDADMDAIHALVAFGVVTRLKRLQPPRYSCFTSFQSRGQPSVETLKTLISPGHPQFIPSKGKKKGSGVSHNSRGHSQSDHMRFCQEAGQKLAEQIHALWPRAIDDILKGTLNTPSGAAHHMVKGVSINIHSAIESIRPEWDRRLALRELEGFINAAQSILNSLPIIKDTAIPAQWNSVNPYFTSADRVPILGAVTETILTRPCSVFEEVAFELPLGLRGIVGPPIPSGPSAQKPAVEISKLNSILNSFRNTNNVVRQKYSHGLLQSLAAFEIRLKRHDFDLHTVGLTPEPIAYAVKNMYRVVEDKFKQLLNYFSIQEHRYPWLELGNLAPFATPTELLQLLRSTTTYTVDASLNQAIVSYGISISNLQRLSRIDSALKRFDERVLQDELHNPGHRNWNPLANPDWLLLELDSDILIREEQVQVAKAIIAPESRENTVLQLNMGAGKTSCVVPMAVATLANGNNLNRLLVPKPLLMQTAQMIQTRLGGLVGRQVYSMPFSRKTPTDSDVLDLYRNLHHECQERHGLILTCHEHLLSFKLGGWQKLVDVQDATAKKMLGFQTWLDSHCRDVLDECDFTLSVKTQLNYPSGTEMPVDGHPYRWQLCEYLLEVTARFLPQLHYNFPEGIEFRTRPGVPRRESFPVVHFLKPDAEDAVHSRIINNVYDGRNPFLRPIDANIHRKRSLLYQVLQGERLDESTLSSTAQLFANPLTAANVLLLMRGLLRNRILLSLIGKRWNVQYGLHPNRHPVAVPFEAKGKPSEQAEFGQPDVAILLTCLSFYYSGLTLKQFRQALSYILQSDDPAAHYERWTSQYAFNLPHWNTLNTDDDGQMETIWNSLRYNRTVINDYMNNYVFPAHARQFETKLQACSWDIPLISDSGAKTTGFSGTNDNRMMLPLMIKQHDLPDLQHTSAEVLSYMLQPRNSEFIVTKREGKRMAERDLLDALMQDGIRVLIDAGAYILENDNKSLAKEWLKVDTYAKAAVYFGLDNRAWVHFRSEAKDDVPLLATPFVDDLSECVVFIDECHCRGVDLKLPTNARGGLTLALKQTKDFTIQAAMRLRQLRTTQSITFYGPPEVSQSIKDVCRLGANARLDSSHVVYWLLEQTCRSIEDQQMLYVAQGTDFCRRTDAVSIRKDFLKNKSQRQELLDVLRQPERQTLEELYGSTSKKLTTISGHALESEKLQGYVDTLRKSGSILHRGYYSHVLEEVEQEREVELQVEQVREVQRPNKYPAFKFPGIHREIVQFFRTGRLSAGAFAHAFAFIAKTSIGKKFGVRETSSKLFVTDEFCRTVQIRHGCSINFMRPVEWIIWCPSTQTALVAIPEEAEWLLRQLQVGNTSPVHLIAYAAPVTKAMLHFQQRGPYSRPKLPAGHEFPAWFARDVGMLAGRLYVDRSEWDDLSEYVQASETDSSERSDRIAPNPAAFLLEWLTVRRKTTDILHTNMGQICTGDEANDGDLDDEL